MRPGTAARRRTLWAMLSDGVRVSRRELARRLGVGVETVLSDLAWLEAAGYVERVPDTQLAVRVLIPLAPAFRAMNVARALQCTDKGNDVEVMA